LRPRKNVFLALCTPPGLLALALSNEKAIGAVRERKEFQFELLMSIDHAKAIAVRLFRAKTNSTSIYSSKIKNAKLPNT
jgi:hypothetical protein